MDTYLVFLECVYILLSPLSGIWYSPLHYHLYSHLLGSTFCMRCVYLVSPSFRFDIRHHALTHKCQERQPQRPGGNRRHLKLSWIAKVQFIATIQNPIEYFFASSNMLFLFFPFLVWFSLGFISSLIRCMFLFLEMFHS